MQTNANIIQRDQVKISALREICKILFLGNLTLDECKIVMALVELNIDLAEKNMHWKN